MLSQARRVSKYLFGSVRDSTKCLFLLRSLRNWMRWREKEIHWTLRIICLKWYMLVLKSLLKSKLFKYCTYVQYFRHYSYDFSWGQKIKILKEIFRILTLKDAPWFWLVVASWSRRATPISISRKKFLVPPIGHIDQSAVTAFILIWRNREIWPE